jgi:galactose-1-phosphate uridylyltransferase
MRHTIIVYNDGHREFVKGYTIEHNKWAEIIYHPELTDKQVEEIMEVTQDKVQELLKKYF